MNSSIHDQISFEPSLDTNFISRTAPECIVLPNGKVNCPVAIYHDRKTWRRSRHQVENEIQQLKEKLEKLKEIRRHLKHTKPTHIIDDEFNITDGSDAIGFNQVHVNLESPGFGVPWFPVTRTNYENVTTERSMEEVSQSTKRRSEENHRTGRRRRPSRVEFENTTVESENETGATKGPAASNHHRHSHIRHHKHHTTTRGYFDVENATTETSSEGTTIHKVFVKFVYI